MVAESSSLPYTDVSAHVADELRRVWLRVEYQTRLGWTKAQAPKLAEEAAVGPEDMGALFAGARGESSSTDEAGASKVLDQWLDTHRRVEGRIRATIDAGIESPLVDLIRTFELTPRQWGTLMFALLPEVDPNLVHAYRYLTRDPTTRGLDGRLLTLLVYDTPQTRSLMARDLSPTSPLLRYRLLDTSSSSGPSESLMFRKLRAATRLVYILDGGTVELDPELNEIAELRTGLATGSFPAIALERAVTALHSGDVVLAVQGQRGLGKKLLLQMAAADCDQRLLVIDSKRLSQQPAATQPTLMRSLIRELMLLDAIPAFVDVDDATVIGDDRDGMPAFFQMFIGDLKGPVAVTINRELMPRIHQRPLVHHRLDVPPLAARVTMWQQVMPTLSAEDADGLAGRFAIPGGVIVAAAQAAEAGRLPLAPRPTASDLDHAVAAQLHQRISRLGKKLPTPFELEDLILDDDTRAAILEITSAARSRRQIRDHFKLRGAAGISVLFSGHPGVGKTMSGTVLAKRLGLDIYEIDLSQVVSKWLGETEKNLSDVFDAAEPGHVVLLFNEADSLFGKRTSDVKSSNDRYANLETNYLLQRLERFNGLTILTTNLTGAIDQAFKRRFTYDVYFTFPSPDMRAELWRRTLPDAARIADIDFDALAEEVRAHRRFHQGRMRARCVRRRRERSRSRRAPAVRDDRTDVPRARQALDRRPARVITCDTCTCRRPAAPERTRAPSRVDRDHQVVIFAPRGSELVGALRGFRAEGVARRAPIGVREHGVERRVSNVPAPSCGRVRERRREIDRRTRRPVDHAEGRDRNDLGGTIVRPWHDLDDVHEAPAELGRRDPHARCGLERVCPATASEEHVRVELGVTRSFPHGVVGVIASPSVVVRIHGQPAFMRFRTPSIVDGTYGDVQPTCPARSASASASTSTTMRFTRLQTDDRAV